MKKKREEMTETYRKAFLESISDRGEKALQGAYEAGRRAMEYGLGVLDLVAVHQEALEFLLKDASSEERSALLEISPKFLKESLSPFELVQRGFQDAVAGLKQKTAELLEINARLEEEIRERKRVEKEVLEIAQCEQRRFGQELHDGVCQNLVGILMMVQALVNEYPRGTLQQSSLKSIADLLDQSVRQARDMAHGLWPVDLEADSLMVSLRNLTAKASRTFRISCQFLCPDPILIQDNNVATHLFRIVQEAVNNAVKHGKAQNIVVSLIKEEKRLVLNVTDDGDGLELSENKPAGIGMMIMRYRARMIDGDLTIKPNELRGASLTCTLPLNSEESYPKNPAPVHSGGGVASPSST